jgi:oligoendopeptidase F
MELEESSELQTFSYVQNMAHNMGGIMKEAFDAMADSNLYDISYGENKFDSSFVVYLYTYGAPYVFVNPTLTEHDKLTFTHEFGHFCNHYASYGSGAGVDVSEVFSQGLEYLSLCYTENTGNLEKIRMATCLTTYVEQAAYASFERQVYNLSGEQLTVENIQALYQTVGTSYGFDSWAWDSRDYVCINHFFTSPMYVISYVVSNDAALQLYQMEKAEKGTGLACYTDNLTTMEAYFLAFLESAGLKSPFDPGRLEEVRKTLEVVLG